MFLAGSWGLPRLGKGQEKAQGAAAAQGPAEVDLLTVAPFDRVTLTDGTVLNVEPLVPRPLPAYDPSKEKQRGKKAEIPPEGNIGLPGEKSKVKMPVDEEEAESKSRLMLHLLTGETRDFRVKRSSIKSVEYYEDMVLAEGEKFVQARDYVRAFECYLRVQARDPKWKGLFDHVNSLLFAEGSAALLEGDSERGLRLLGVLSARTRNFPGLADKLAASYGGRAARAFELGMYARGRKILHDGEALAPDHVALREVHDRFVKKAKELVASAGSKQGPDKLDALTEAIRVWPTLQGADAAYRDAFLAVPTLDIAVNDVPRGVGPWIITPADDRIARLLYRPVLARDDEEAMQGKADGQLASAVTTSDLGRRIVIAVRRDVPWSDGSRPVSAIDVARALTDAAEPGSLRFAARWADMLDRVEVSEDGKVEIRLTRAFLKPGAWLLGPVGPAHGGGDGRVALINRGRALVVDGPYRWIGSNADRATLRAAEPTGDSSSAERALKVQRIKEVRYPTAKATIGAFLRGEVALIERVPPDRVAELEANPEFKVGRYARPSLHLIALDGRNKALRNRSLRRGLSYAIDRRALLEETLLRKPADAANLVADGPFPKGSYADAPDVKPLGYDPLLARMLLAAARKELGGQPIKLTFEYPAIPEAQAAVPKIVEALKLAGLEIVATERPESELESALRASKKFDLVYRVSRVEEPIVDAGPLLSPAYDAPPATDPLASLASPRILQLLLQLERAPEWPTAKGLVVQIDRECRDELPVLPLWQLEDHYAWRTRLKGPSEVSERLYDGIATWEIEPWFAKDQW
jgi:peptide/nickel transport system substrate-binding protein